MIIQNAVGGWFKILELDLTLGPGQVVDLDFYCSRQEQKSSKELQRAITRRHIKVLKPDELPQGAVLQVYLPGSPPPSKQTLQGIHPLVLVRTDVPESPTYESFMMRDLHGKLSMLRKTSSVGLLQGIVRGEQNPVVLRTAYKKLQELTGRINPVETASK